MINSIIRHIPLLLLLLAFASASPAISESVVGQLSANQRRLLQIKKPCPVNFENLNYTVITSKCKGPDYPPGPCCSGLKEFACPYANEIDDLTSDCADVMFSYIQKVGEYPPGLFSGKCGDGLCPDASPPPPALNSAPPLLLPPLFSFPLYILL